MGDTIRGLDWMSARDEGARRSRSSRRSIRRSAIPTSGRTTAACAITRGVVLGRTSWPDCSWNVADDRAQIGKPVDRGRWGMTPPTSNAYYNPLLNEIVFPAGILQPPAFDVHAADAVNYGAIGVVIGHEISHGFDDQGAQYDAQGRLNNWWTAGRPEALPASGRQCVSDQFDSYFIEPGIHHNGKLVLGESIGDLAGAKIAYLRVPESAADAGPQPTIDGFTPEQQFFIAWGQFRGDETRPETQRTDGPGRSASDREVPRHRTAVEPPRVRDRPSAARPIRRWCARSDAWCGSVGDLAAALT